MKILAIGDFHGKFPEKLKEKIKKEEIDFILSDGDYAGIEEWRPLMKKFFKAREKGKKVEVKDFLGKEKYNNLLKRDYESGKIPLKELDKFKVKVFSVFGNGDWYKVFFNDYGKNYENFIKKLKYTLDINRRKGKFKGLNIVGFGGYLDPDIYFTKKGISAISDLDYQNKKRKKRYNQEEKKFMKLIKNKPEIILAHYTPYNCLDKMKVKGFALSGGHMGMKFFNEGIKKYSPKLFVCGHMHENQGKCKIGKTLVVNPGAASEGKAAIIEIDDEKKKIKSVKFLK